MDAHIPDEELSLFAHDPEELTHQRRTEIEQHTANCAKCGKSLNFYTITEEDLRDPLVWQPVLVTCDPVISGYASRCAAEDAEADWLLKDYFAAPPMAAWVDVTARREFRSGGVVRRLNARAHAIVASEPRAALTYADQAQAIADLLPDDTYPNGAVYELRGTAWKERANALLRLGELDEALESLKRAERAYGRITSSGHGLAAVELVRAAVYYQRGKLDQAARHAGNAEHEYAYLGLKEQQLNAVLLRGQIKYEAMEYTPAAAIFQQLIEYGEEAEDASWVARGSYCRAACELELGNISDAAMLFHRALVIFRETGPATERISTDWGLARVVLQGGKPGEAARRLRDVIAEFDELGMASDAALAGVDLSEALLALDRHAEIVKVATHAFRVLKKAGILTGALTALAYLKDAAAKGRLTLPALTAVRTFLRRIDREPHLVFVPPPDISDNRIVE
jgi:tetratricopeptide (TPR) repeat protein